MRKALLSLASFSVIALSASFDANAVQRTIIEAPGMIRVSQYINGTFALWRMPTPGTSVYPGSTCKNLQISGAQAAAMINRFMALYMAQSASGNTFMLQYEDTTCQVTSFAFDQ